MTLGMMRAIHAAGLNCPRDIAVGAFDDFLWADSFRPQLTAMAQPAFAMGEDAVRLLIDRMSKRRTGRGVRLTTVDRVAGSANLRRPPARSAATEGTLREPIRT